MPSLVSRACVGAPGATEAWPAAGAERSIFVQNEVRGSLLCTLPVWARPRAAAEFPTVDETLSRIFSEHRVQIRPDVLELLDASLERHVVRLAENQRALDVHQDSAKQDGAKLHQRQNGRPVEDFREGDRVRLRKGVRGSFLAAERLSKVGKSVLLVLCGS